MTTPRKPLVEVTNRAIEVLYRELGPSEALRFVNQFTNGFGDYTAERDSLLGPITLDQILAEIKRPTARSED